MLIGSNIIGTVGYMGGVMSLPTPFVHSWQQMIEYNYEHLLNPGELIKYDRATVSYHSFARNSLVDNMYGDWLLQLDTDITFEPDLLGRMLNKMYKFDVDVLVGMYLYKSPPHAPVMYNYDPVKKEKQVLGDWQQDADLIPIKGAGAGCLLVRRRVFDKIRATGQGPFDIYIKDGAPLSEDHSFFERLWDLKIRAYWPPDIYVKHLTYKELDPYKDYDRTNLRIGKHIKPIDKFWK